MVDSTHSYGTISTIRFHVIHYLYISYVALTFYLLCFWIFGTKLIAGSYRRFDVQDRHTKV